MRKVSGLMSAKEDIREEWMTALPPEARHPGAGPDAEKGGSASPSIPFASCPHVIGRKFRRKEIKKRVVIEHTLALDDITYLG
jgi:hypothetical protein